MYEVSSHRGARGHKLLISMAAEVILAQSTQPSAVRVDSLASAGPGLSVRDLLHVGLLESRTTLFFLPLLRSFIAVIVCFLWGGTAGVKEDIHLEKVSLCHLSYLSSTSLAILGNLAFITLAVCSSTSCQAAVVSACCHGETKSVHKFSL